MSPQQDAPEQGTYKLSNLNLEADDKAVKKYFEQIKEECDIYFKTHNKGNPPESAVEPHFITLLNHCSRVVGWKLVNKKALPNGNIPDGTFLEPAGILAMGYMESKDDDDTLDDEIKIKLNEKSYPRFNILFWQPKRIVLIQNKKIVRDESIRDNQGNLVSILNNFFNYEHFDRGSWNEAIKTFDEQMPILAKGLLEKIEESEKKNKNFVGEFDKFYNLCKSSINPNINKDAIKEMIVQHLLTERILESIFDLKRFTQDNAVAGQLDKVISSMTSKYFNRVDFLGTLDHFYDAIIKAADKLEDFKTKQVFLNDIFERFFQGWAIKSADRLGIVYTPQSVVDFMVNSVDEILKREFGKKHGLGSKNVHIIDPFVGTGNFIVNVIDKISPTKLEQKYESELHCNEIQLMPYYIANMNIEHAYFEAMGERKEFPGICFADTFQMFEDEAKQKEEKNIPKLLNKYMNEENSERVRSQREKEIFVVISNPPYNSNQSNEMDNNKNRKYKKLEQAISDTYSKDSKATNTKNLADPYVKAIKWASQRIGDEGVVAMITNNGFIDQYAFDGVRKHLSNDFDKVYVLDLGGNVRKNPKLSGTTHNVFGIQVGVSVNIFIKKKDGNKDFELNFADVDTFWKKEQKYEFLTEKSNIEGIDWKKLTPNKNHLWLTEGMADDFEEYLLMGDKKQKGKEDCDTIFNMFSLGVATSRDQWVYSFNKQELAKNVESFVSTYNSEVNRLTEYLNREKKDSINIDDFVTYDERKIKWNSSLKQHCLNEKYTKFDSIKIRKSKYRPFCESYLYFDHFLNQRRYQQHHIFPTPESEKENKILCVTNHSQVPFSTQISKIIPSLDVGGRPTQSFPFYTYNEDGTGRKENITDKTLVKYQDHYKNQQPPSPVAQDIPPSKRGLKEPPVKGVRFSTGKSGGLQTSAGKPITKWDIFYYIYAMLHHPDYREDFKENLKRSLPRIPFAPDFRKFSKIGKKLADIHLNYEDADIYELDEIVDKDIFPSAKFRVEKMKLNKDKTDLIYNDAITLKGIPEEVFEYKLGNRSALEWIIDQYRVKTDKRSGITQDPNNFDGNEKYIFELIGKIVTVSLKTVKLVRELSKLPYK